MAESSRFERGLEIERKLNDQLHTLIETSTRDVAPDFGQITTEFCFGEIYNRPGLDLRSRQIVTIAVLSVGGHCQQLPQHVLAGLNAGLTREEISEILIQVAIYGGWPVALSAMQAVKDLFKDEGCVSADGNSGLV